MKTAAIQLSSGPDIEENLQDTERLIREAADEGAVFIITPEVTDQVIAGRADKISEHHTQDDHPGIPFFSSLAKELSIDLVIGSMCVRISEDKLANRSFHFGSDGQLKATYDKIHLYDVDLPSGESHRESNTFAPGNQLVLSTVQNISVGLTICYDMRFPHLFRDLAKQGAKIITAPSAFTVPTGKAHWHTLLRARAIESGAFIIAPAQVGDHQGARVTYGHSIIIAPWGEIIAERIEDTPGIVLASLDLAHVDTARQAIPSLQHDRNYLAKTE